MRIELRSPWSRIMAPLLACTLLATFLFLLQRQVRATMWARSADIVGLQRAVGLQPANAALLHRIARLQLYSEQDPTRALATLDRAIALNPHSPWYWLDRAVAHQILGDLNAQGSDLEHATRIDPRTPVVAWETANFLLATGDHARSLERFRIVVENDPAHAADALRLAWRATQSVDAVLDRAVPDTVQAHMTLIDVLIAERNTSEALKTWAHLLQKGLRADAASSARFLEYLLREEQVQPAVEVARAIGEDPALMAANAAGNVSLVDPSFEDDPLTGGFHWRISPPDSVSMAIDDATATHGSRSLKIAFAGAGMQQPGLARLIPVEPGATYDIRTSFRSEDLRTTDPPHWRIDDAYTHQVIAESATWNASTAWREIVTTIKVPPQTRLIGLTAFRHQPQAPIRGMVWVDHLVMVKR